MPSVIRYIDNDGKVKTRDPNRVALVNRKGVVGLFVRKTDIDVSKLTVDDAGLVVYADEADALGSGAGMYFWDGTYFRAMMRGHQSIVCTSGESIIVASNRQAMMGASVITLTSASALTPGTATTKPLFPDGYAGQEVVLINGNASDAITLTDEAGMAASNLQLISNTTLALAAGRGIHIVFDGADWRQVGPVTDALS